jgi:hypothetical protein
MSEETHKPQGATPETAGGASSSSPSGPTAPTPGAPSDALAAFGDALAKAAKSTSQSDSDPQVSAAFALGWQMAELYRPQRRRRVEATDDDLPGLGSLGDRDRIEILVDQVQVQLTRLHEPIQQAGLPAIGIGPLRTSLGDEQARRNAVRTLHRALLGTLTATDFRLGKAYGLGRALADTCRKPTDLDDLQEQLGDNRIANLRGWLDDLSTAFPPHAAHSVGTSLEEWVKWAACAQHEGTPEDALRALRRQGELWRTLLSGEKRGTEMLEIDNYLDAARQLAGMMRSIVQGVIRRFPLLTALAGAMLAGGVALLIIGGSSEIVAGATSILAALGLSWRGLGGAAGQLAGKLEQPLWDAILDSAITDAITLLPRNKADHRDRRALALQMPSPANTPGQQP